MSWFSFQITPLDIALVLFAFYLWGAGGHMFGRIYRGDVNGSAKDATMLAIMWPGFIAWLYVEWTWELVTGLFKRGETE